MVDDSRRSRDSRGKELLALRQLENPSYIVGGQKVSAMAMKAVLRAIDDADGGRGCWSSHETIGSEVRTSSKTVQRAIDALEKLGLITVDRRPGTTDVYRIRWESIFHPPWTTSPGLTANRGNHPGLQVHPPWTTSPPTLDLQSTPLDFLSDAKTAKSLPGKELRSIRRTETRRNEKETKRKRESARAHKFLPPSLGEVIDYWKATSLEGNADAFHDYYEANGWTQGKNKKIRDWKAAARLWSRNQKNFESKKKTTGFGAGQVYDPNANIKEAWET
jgi:hypothetical protein